MSLVEHKVIILKEGDVILYRYLTRDGPHRFYKKGHTFLDKDYTTGCKETFDYFNKKEQDFYSVIFIFTDCSFLGFFYHKEFIELEIISKDEMMILDIIQ
jgi:hypothetical protein